MAGIVVVALAACGARTGLEAPTGMDAERPADAGLDARGHADVRLDAALVSPDALDALDVFTSLDALALPDAFTDPDALAPPDASHDAAPDVLAPDAGDPCEIGPDPLAEPVCTRPLFGRVPTLSCPGGFVDVAAQGSGVLAWECDGTRAEARFGPRVYRGQRVRDQVSLCIRTEFDYVDGCRWQSSQRLEGNATGAEITLTYREVAISGDGSCFPPCTADSIVELR